MKFSTATSKITSDEERKHHGVPHAQRGLTLQQIHAVLVGVNEESWLESTCTNYNSKKKTWKKNEHPKSLNMYALNEYFVSPTTSCNKKHREKIPNGVIKAAGVPEAPLEDISYSEMVNPEGVRVDYFVSHWWGHDFKRTVACLSNFANEIYVKIGKNSPDEVVFWICTFALNQHRAKEEVGATPEEGPFNKALEEAKHGAVMILDAKAEPMSRIWCLFEVARAKELQQSLELIGEEGSLTNSSIDTLEGIAKKLVTVRASKADASNDDDKLKILFRILDRVRKRSILSIAQFKLKLDLHGMKEFFFKEFDVHVCELIATPLMEAGLAKKSAAVCMRAVGMGATVTVEQLEDLIGRIGADLQENVETRFGSCSLANVFARSGSSEQLEYVLDAGVAVNSEDGDDRTPLHAAAEQGHLQTCRILLARGAEVGHKTKTGGTALHSAAQCGRLEVSRLLLDNDAEVSDKVNIGSTPLNLAATVGFTKVCSLLLDRGADVHDKNNLGFTSLISAAENGHLEVCEVLLNRGADVHDKTNKRFNSLIMAAKNGHLKVCKLLIEAGASVGQKNSKGRTALHFAAYCGHTETCKLLLVHGADISVKNVFKETALDEAKDGGHGENTDLCTLLQNHSAD